MPTPKLPPRPTIRITLKGFAVSRIRDGAPSAQIGALRNSPCHQPRIEISKITPDEKVVPVALNLPDPLTDDFSLSVQNVAPGIQVFQRDSLPFNRLNNENDSRDFRWFIDLPDFYNKPVVIDDNTLGPNFKFESGVFYCNAKSPGEVNIVRVPPDPSPQRFGNYGLEIGANIYLEPPQGVDPESSAVFKYGATELFPPVTASSGDRYVIVINCDCEIDRDESDFPLIHEVLGNSLNAQDKQITLAGHPVNTGGDHTPEVYCGPPNCSSCSG